MRIIRQVVIKILSFSWVAIYKLMLQNKAKYLPTLTPQKDICLHDPSKSGSRPLNLTDKTAGLGITGMKIGHVGSPVEYLPDQFVYICIAYQFCKNHLLVAG